LIKVYSASTDASFVIVAVPAKGLCSFGDIVAFHHLAQNVIDVHGSGLAIFHLLAMHNSIAIFPISAQLCLPITTKAAIILMCRQ